MVKYKVVFIISYKFYITVELCHFTSNNKLYTTFPQKTLKKINKH